MKHARRVIAVLALAAVAGPALAGIGTSPG
jgi:hypothetical protein